MILLDTHALVWWVASPVRIPLRARKLIDAAVDARDPLAVSSISIWEIAMLATVGRLSLALPLEAWIAAVESLPIVEFHPVDNRIAARAVTLEGFPHRDPADRMIVATALVLGAVLVTGDARLRSYRPLKSVWT